MQAIASLLLLAKTEARYNAGHRKENERAGGKPDPGCSGQRCVNKLRKQ
jgi:hypothetical protein